jgi:hypothetical protein
VTDKKNLEDALAEMEASNAKAAEYRESAAFKLEETERNALEARMAALPQAQRRKVLDAAGLKHVSAAPRPLTPIRFLSHAPSKPATQVQDSVRRALVVSEQAGGDGTAPPSKIFHSTKTRRDTLTPVIEQAQRQCTDPLDTAAVWAVLLVLAEKKTPPLIGATEDGLQYLKGGTAEIFKRSSLGKRLTR